MSTQKLTNISIKDYLRFLKNAGCIYSHTNGGHQIWKKEGLTRPIVVQTHVNPVPKFIIENALRSLGLTKKDFFDYLRD
jgi:predicted RNA binding protein YcfA (HicA-like mRNA interferase family)